MEQIYGERTLINTYARKLETERIIHGYIRWQNLLSEKYWFLIPLIPVVSVLGLQFVCHHPIKGYVIICCHVTNVYKFSEFTQPQFISSQFCR